MVESTMNSADEALVLSAENEIRNYTGVRVWADALRLVARNGVLEIGGHVRTRAEREVTENVALKTKGIKDVISHLYVDTDLEIAVGRALGMDARTRGGFPGILVGSAFGDIYLKGSVPSADMKKAAAEISGKVDGVRNVINALETSAAATPAAAGAKPAVAAKPVVAGAKPVVAVKPPTPAAVKPGGGVKVPAPVSGKPVVARAGAGSGSAVKPPASVSGRPVVARGGAVVTTKPAETPAPAEEAPIVEDAAAEVPTAAIVEEPVAVQAVEEIVEETAAPTPAPAPVAKPTAAARPNASGITPVTPPASVTGRPVVTRRTNKPTEE